MQDRQTAGLDLPIRFVAWQDADGATWLTFNDAEWLAERHGLGPQSAGAVGAVAAGTKILVRAATE